MLRKDSNTVPRQDTLAAERIDRIRRQLQGGDPEFPASLRLVVAVNKALADPDASVSKLSSLIAQDPLIAARLLALANCVTFNPYGRPVYAVDAVIQRLGFNVVRIMVAAIATSQLKSISRLANCAHLFEQKWEKAIFRSCVARLLASDGGTTSPDQAAFAALIADVAEFFVLTILVGEGGSNEAQLEAQLAEICPAVMPNLLRNLQLEAELVEALLAQKAEGAADGLARILWRAQSLVETPEAALSADEAELVSEANKIALDLMSQLTA